MKEGKFLIVMILVALGFSVNAQRGVHVNDSYNSVRKYIHPLQLSQGQVADWSRLNRATDLTINDIQRSRGLSPRAKARKIESVLDRQDRRIRNILSRRQYSKFRSMRGSGSYRNSNYRNGNYRNGNSCGTGYSNQGRGNNRGYRTSNYYDGY